ncbi:photosystem I reaction center subunit XI, partial [Nostoc sp.]
MSNTSDLAEIIKQYNEEDIIKPFKGDPQLGNLSTPINDSPLVRAFIENLPAYCKA